jgi:hypothetical protein
METIEDNLQPAAAPQLLITEDAKYFLSKAGQWANFLGIMGFIGTGLIALMALFVGTIFTTLSQVNPMMGAVAGMGSLFTVIYLLIAVFNFFFALYLYQFGDKIKRAVLYSSSEEATLAFTKLKSFFKLWGITTIVIISFYVLIFLFAIIGGAAALMGTHN